MAKRIWNKRGIGIGSMLAVVGVVSMIVAQCAFAAKAFEGSPQWKDGQFHNPEPMVNHMWDAMKRTIKGNPKATPSQPLPVVRVDKSIFDTAPASGLRLTWLGHSSSILEIDEARFLLDPVWGRSSPVSWAGPKRWYEPLIDLDSLPPFDAVLVSHDHYDHLDRSVVEHFEKSRRPRYVVPLGVGSHLRDWGVDSSRIVELDWWEAVRVDGIEITATPARHASGRGAFDRDKSLWSGFALKGAAHKVWYSGDTGPQKAFEEIGRRLGPFDLTLVECGQYDPAWPDWHMSPEQSLAAHKAVGGKAMIPVHWGLFRLALHDWDEPAERLLAANADSATQILVPRPGQTLEPTRFQTETWWRMPAGR